LPLLFLQKKHLLKFFGSEMIMALVKLILQFITFFCEDTTIYY